MFGSVKPYLQDLSEAEKHRYRAVYCGLCRALEKRYGLTGRVCLTYDLAFLALLLSSLYEPEETCAAARCVPHPGKRHQEVSSPVLDYAADMTVALMYFKCLDDWRDEGKPQKKLYADLLKKHYRTVKAAWPDQCRAMEENIAALSALEKRENPSPDEAAGCFGQLMAALFLWKKDFWERQLRWFGLSLGRFIYMLDAALDYEQDQKKGNYNPLLALEKKPEEAREMLMLPLGEASEAFESLPLVQDAHLMRNILYSGVWQSYNEQMTKKAGRDGHDR